MEKNSDIELNRRVDEALAALGAARDWEPDLSAGLERLRARREGERGRIRRRAWMGATAAAICLSAAAFPTPRAAAQRICETCQGLFLKKVDSLSRLRPEAQRKTAPAFRLTDANGSVVALSAYRGKVVLLDFWATWCGGCKVEIPWFVEFANEYRQRGLAVIGVAMDDSGWKIVKPFIEQKRVDYTIVLGNNTVAKQYSVGAMPLTVLIDRGGRIAATHAGVVDRNAFEKEIQQLLREPAAAPAA